MFSILFVACLLNGAIAASENRFLEQVTYTNCEGKDSANYTLVRQFQRDSRCSVESAIQNNIELLACGASAKQTAVNHLQILSSQVNPNGAQTNFDVLGLITSGPLEGKFAYVQEIYLDVQYLKTCSSVLGYSYVSSKVNTLLLSDKLDLNVLISPTGAFELFKKGCTTVCKGSAIIVGKTQ